MCNHRDGSVTNEEGDEVNEVTGFAYDASTTDFGVLSPVIEGNGSGVDAIVDVKGFSTMKEERGKRLGKRGISAVETYCE